MSLRVNREISLLVVRAILLEPLQGDGAVDLSANIFEVQEGRLRSKDRNGTEATLKVALLDGIFLPELEIGKRK